MNKNNVFVVFLGFTALTIFFSSCSSIKNDNMAEVENQSLTREPISIQLPKLIALLSSKQEVISPIMEMDTTEGFIVWDCKDYVDPNEILFQIGYFTLLNDKDLVIGFIIRDKPFLQDIIWTEGTPMPGENISPDSLRTNQILSPSGIAPSAESSLFSKSGLDYKWDWGNHEIGENYTIIMQPDGAVLYYNFTNVPDGQSISPTGVYKAYKQ